jgi:hypothetical protein
MLSWQFRCCSGYLRTLDTESCRQSFLTEGESINSILRSRGGQQLHHTLVHHYQARTDADLLAISVRQLFKRYVRHEKQRIPERLRASLGNIHEKENHSKARTVLQLCVHNDLQHKRVDLHRNLIQSDAVICSLPCPLPAENSCLEYINLLQFRWCIYLCKQWLIFGCKLTNGKHARQARI